MSRTSPKISPVLRRAKAVASGIAGLRPKEYGAAIWWYWEPSPSQRKAGWSGMKLGTDMQAAIASAIARNQEIEDWRTGGAKPRDIAPLVRRHTIRHMIRRYDAEYLARWSKSYIATTRSHLKEVDTLFGDVRMDELLPKHVLDYRDRLMGWGKHTAKGPMVDHHTAHNRLRTIKALFNWAMSPHVALASANPAHDFALPKPKGRRHVWESDAEALFTTAAMDLGYPSIALAIECAIYFGQRPQDLIALSEDQLVESHLADPALRRFFEDEDGRVIAWQLDQKKTGTPLHIPLAPDLLARVRVALRANRAKARASGALRTFLFINDQTGQPWAMRGFQRVWKAILDHAASHAGKPELSELQWRDLRRTRVVRLRRRNYSKEMISAITGHSPKSIDAMLEVYGPIDPTITAAAIMAAETPPPTAIAQRKEA